MWLAKLGKGMLFLVKQAFVARDEIPAPLKMPTWEAVWAQDLVNFVLFTLSGVAVRKMSSKPKESDEAFDARWKAYFERQDYLYTVNSALRHILHKNIWLICPVLVVGPLNLAIELIENHSTLRNKNTMPAVAVQGLYTWRIFSYGIKDLIFCFLPRKAQ